MSVDVRFEPAEPIRVIQHPEAPEEPAFLLGKEGSFVRYTARGYAMVAISGLAWSGAHFYVHPENLERL